MATLDSGTGTPIVVGRVQGVGEILGVQLDAKPRLEIALEHQGYLGVEDRAARQAAPDGLEHLLRAHAGLRGQDHRLGHGSDVQGHDDLIGELRDVAAADVADPRNGRSHGQQDTLDLLERVFRPPHHDGQRPRDGLGLAATDRRVEHDHAPFPDLGRDLLAGQWGDRAHVDQDHSLPGPFENAVRPQHGLPHVRRVGKHRNDHLASGGHVLGRGATMGTGLDQLSHPVGDDVVYSQAVSGLDEVQGHGPAHDAQTNETDPCHLRVSINFQPLSQNWDRVLCVTP